MIKRVTYVVLTLLLFSNCTNHYIRIFEASSNNTKLKDGYLVFESDSIKVTYEFWAEKGVLSFSVYNKLDKPIYINWKNSSFIYNSLKLNYWIDEQQTTFSNYYGSYFYKGPLIKSGYTLSEGVQTGQSNIIKPEKTTFIPPQSFYYRSQFYILPSEYFLTNSDSFEKTTVIRNDDSSKKTNIYTLNFKEENSPLKFRNFLSISLEENSNNFIYIDNSFYLKSINEMDYLHFEAAKLNDTDTNPLKKKNSFYLKVEETNSLEFNNRMLGNPY